MKDDYDDYHSPAPPPAGQIDPTQDALAAEHSDWYAPEDESALRHLLFKYLPILFLCVFAFWPAWRSGQFLWLDDLHITENNPLKSTEGLWRLWWNPTVAPDWAPLSYSWLWPQRYLWQTGVPLGYHLVSLFLHTFNAIMVWMLLRRVDVPGAFMAAVVFALHPLQVEPVSWLAQQPMLFGTFWGLLFSLIYLRYAGADNTVVDPSKIFRFPETTWLLYALAIGCYLLAILSQPLLVCTLPLAVGVVAWWKRDDFGRADLARLAPFVAMGIAGAALHWVIESKRPDFERSFGVLESLLVPARAVWFYLYRTLVPAGLATGYRDWAVSGRDLLQWLALGSLVVIGLAVWLKRRDIGKTAIAALGVYLLLLLPMITPLNRAEMVNGYVADRFHYLAMIVPAGVIIGLITTALGRIPRDTRQWVAPVAGVVLALVLMVVVNAGRARTFTTPLAMWSNSAGVDEENVTARVWLGKVYQERGELGQALRAFETVDRTTAGRSLEAKIAMGEIAEAEGKDLNLAAWHYQNAIDIAPDRPEGYRHLGATLVKQKKYDDALKLYDQALARFGGDAELHRLMGHVVASQGRHEDAVGWYEKSLELNPNNAATHVDYAKVLLALKKGNEALKQYEAALKVDPRNFDAFMGAAGLLLIAGNHDEALRLFRIAAYLKSDDAEAAHMVGVTRIVLAQKAWQRGDIAVARNLIKEATADLTRSLERDKDNPRVKNNMEYARQLAQRIEMGPPPRSATRATQPTTQP